MSSEDETQDLHLPCSSDNNVRLNQTYVYPNSPPLSNVAPSSSADLAASAQVMDATSDPEGPDTSVQPELQSRPPTLQMVAEALKAKGDKHGTSVAAIKFYIHQMYPAVNTKRLRYLLKQALAKGVSDGVLVRPRNSTVTGARGRFKLVSKYKTRVTQTKSSTAAVKPRKKKTVRTSEAGKVSSESLTKGKIPAAKKKVPTEALTKGKIPATKKKVSTEASTKRKVPETKKKVPTEASTKKKVLSEASTKRKIPASKKKLSSEASTKRNVPATEKKVPTKTSTKREIPETKKVPSTKGKVPATVEKVPMKVSTKKKPPEEAKKATKGGIPKEDSKPKGARTTKDVEEVRAKARGMKPKAEIPKGKKKTSISPKKVVEEHKAEKNKLRTASEAPPKTRKQKGSPNIQAKSKAAATMSKTRRAGGAKDGGDEPRVASQTKSKLDMGIKPSTSQFKVSRESDTVKDQPKGKGKKPEASKVFKKTGKSPKGSSSKPASKKVK
ncbi:histone H1.8 [Petaurus breviceps papuanus]|uniref:histone H1.8 n=1 Tax=Petaurus breviceps papuanus TaxID=3040969 RepID=UPI0036DC3F24